MGSTMEFMFYNATSFDAPIDEWDVSQVFEMNLMFKNATSFNQPIDGWNVSQVNNMTEMFDGASSFNQCLSTWAKKTSDSVNTTNTTSMLNGTSCTSDYVNPTFGPWCQDAFNGCIVPTSAPSASLRPTVQPSTSAAPSTSTVPSTSVAPSFLPSLSMEPSTSAKPSVNEACPEIPAGACNICGDGKCISQPNAIFQASPDSEGATCGGLQEAGLIGLIGPSQCPRVQEVVIEQQFFINCECTSTGVLPTVAPTIAPSAVPSTSV